MAEVALSLVTIGQLFTEVDWLAVLSISATAGVYAILTCIKGLPEVNDGVSPFKKEGKS
jgi:hypothetical protein